MPFRSPLSQSLAVQSESKASVIMDTGKQETDKIRDSVPPQSVEGKESSATEDIGEWDNQEHQVCFVFLNINSY